METPEQHQKARKPAAMSATELLSGGESEARQQGRRLILKFIGGNHPQLDRIDFRWNESSQPAYWQQGDSKSPMSWTKVPQALALVFLGYLCSEERVGPTFYSGARTGSLAASLGDAITDKTSRLHALFMERQSRSTQTSRVKQVFGGKNVHGKEDGDRRILVLSDYLPPDCIEVYWSLPGQGRITNLETLRDLNLRIRQSLEIPTEAPATEGEGTQAKQQAKQTTTAAPPEPREQEEKAVVTASTEGTSSPPAQPTQPAASVERVAERLLTSLEAALLRRSEPKPQPKEEAAKESAQTPAKRATGPKVPPIPPQLFAIHNPEGLAWEDSQGLLDFGDGEGQDDIWRIKDACEGALILGAPGSGKTSASGFALSQAFLTAGFGGLVLAAKPEEASRWVRLCQRFGRAEDCVVVTPDGPHKLNVLAYETQRPRERLGMTDDLIAFFRVLIAIVSKRAGDNARDDFWTNATNQLMRELFDVFLLADEPMTIDALTRFVSKAPEQSTKDWQSIEFFGEILSRAEKGIKGTEDQRIYDRVRDYWTATYPNIAHQTRSGIVLGFTAMANALSGRGIHELISSETTLTPESVLSGKIVILDLPLKECGQGGLLIQAAWKYLFQRAVERRADKGRETARPVFLWADEGHLFFSQHDIDFQPTARDCRVAHVIISQSLHNFYQLGHNPHAVQGVFATMNTHIYHANGDLETSKWASEKLGTTLTRLVNVSISSQPKRSGQPKHWLWDMFKEDERESTASTSINQHRDKVFQPEAFAELKKGGDGSCEAVVLWVSHQFAANRNRPFRVTVFEQDNNR